MTRQRPHVTEAELGVLETLWETEPATIRSITDHLYTEVRTSQYATVQKLLERLEAKGYVKRERKTVPHRFRSRVDRRRLIANRLRDIADTLCNGSMSPLLTQLLESTKLTDGEIQTLRALVKKLEKDKSRD